MPANFLMLVALLAAGHTEVKSECLELQDLAFVLDGSLSVCGDSSASSCPNWNFYRQFIHKIVDSMTIGPDDIRVAVVTFSDKAQVLWGLNEHTNKVSLLSAIDKIEYPKGDGRNTPAALEILLTEVFASSADERPDITQTAIIITDGLPTVKSKRMASAIIELEYSDVITYVVGVTKDIPEYLPKMISSAPHELDVNYFMVKDYSSLNKVRKDLQKEICRR